MSTEIVDINGVVAREEILEEPPRLKPGALRRLYRLAARVEGSAEAAQAAINVHSQVRQVYQDAFEQACEDASIPIPPGEHDVQIDWTTGNVGFRPRG